MKLTPNALIATSSVVGLCTAKKYFNGGTNQANRNFENLTVVVTGGNTGIGK